MLDHTRYLELAALAAGGHLSEGESQELRAHLAGCDDCRREAEAYRDLVCVGLPLVRAATAHDERANDAPAPGARERFLARARADGVRFSPAVEAQPVRGLVSGAEDLGPRTRWPLGYRVAAGLAFAASLVAAFYLPQLTGRPSAGGGSAAELDQVRRTNAQLSEQLAARGKELAAQAEQLRQLRGDLAAATTAANELRRTNDQQGVQLGQSTSRAASLFEELQDRDRQLASATDEIARINQVRLTDRAALNAQGARLKEIHDQLRIATATVEAQRQMAAAGQDLLKLLLAKQLRVIDVRDTDASGRPSAVFARVFVTDRQAIRIFAFDMNEGGGEGGRRLQVWGEQIGDRNSVRNLGVLTLDDRTQNRWSLSVQNAAVVNDINSVFVTASARGGAPEGRRLLYAFLGPGTAQ